MPRSAGACNKALGLALRKRFCATFDFELQAAANDDAFVLSLGPQHSFGLDTAPKLLSSNTAAATLTQATLASPMFTSRWRWNLNRSLAVLRFRGGRKNPLPIQRMEADDLMAAVFPSLAACQENAPAGPVEIPDHVLVRQTLYDCLHEAMDVDGLVEVVKGFESGSVRTHFVDSPEPSVLSHEILNGKPYTFLDDAPLEERRTRAVQLRRGLPLQAGDMGKLDPNAIARVREEAAPVVRDAEELHDLLLATVLYSARPEWAEWFAALGRAGRALTVVPRCASRDEGSSNEMDEPVRDMWCALERRTTAESILPDASFMPDVSMPGAATGEAQLDPEAAAADSLRGHLDLLGPVTVAGLARISAIPMGLVQIGLARLEAEGFAMRGSFDEQLGGGEQWCARRLLARVHSYTQARLRREIEPVTAQDYMRFVLQWQHVAPGTQRQGRAGVLAVVDQLQGFELPAGAWEESVLAARVENYQSRWLEDLCMSGELVWGRLSARSTDAADNPRQGCFHPLAGHTDHVRSEGGPALASRGFTWRCRTVGTGARSFAGRPRCPEDTGGTLPFGDRRARQDAYRSRSRRDSGIWSPGASSPPTGSRRCAPCSRRAKHGGEGTETRCATGWDADVPHCVVRAARDVGRCCLKHGTTRIPTAWRSRSPGSFSPAGEWSSGIFSGTRSCPCRGASCFGRYDVSKRVASYEVGAS